VKFCAAEVKCYSLSGDVLAEVTLGSRATFANLRLALRSKVSIESWNDCAQSGPKCNQGVNAHSGFVMCCFCLGQSLQKCVAVIARVGTLRCGCKSAPKETNQSLRFFAIDGGELEDHGTCMVDLGFEWAIWYRMVLPNRDAVVGKHFPRQLRLHGSRRNLQKGKSRWNLLWPLG